MSAFNRISLLGALCLSLSGILPAMSNGLAQPTQVSPRHAYQTGNYSEKVRKHYSNLLSDYLAELEFRSKRSHVLRALDAGRAAEEARNRRAYSTRYRGTGFDGGTRHAYST